MLFCWFRIFDWIIKNIIFLQICINETPKLKTNKRLMISMARAFHSMNNWIFNFTRSGNTKRRGHFDYNCLIIIAWPCISPNAHLLGQTLSPASPPPAKLGSMPPLELSDFRLQKTLAGNKMLPKIFLYYQVLSLSKTLGNFCSENTNLGERAHGCFNGQKWF